jgi:hypothetical protein
MEMSSQLHSPVNFTPEKGPLVPKSVWTWWQREKSLPLEPNPDHLADYSLGVKRPQREADHSPPSSAEAKNAWTISPLPQYVFMGWYSVIAQGQLYLYITFTEEC